MKAESGTRGGGVKAEGGRGGSFRGERETGKSSGRSGSKRKGDGPSMGGSSSSEKASGEPSKKRRFVWPDLLHAKFVSAVFDVGLRSSSAQTIAGAIARPGVDVATIERLLARYRVTRGVASGPRAANAKDAAVCTLSEEQPLIESVEAKPSGDAARATRREEPVEDETLADAASEIFAQSVAIARRQVEIALQSDELLRRFQGRLRATLDRQRLLIAAIKSGQHNGAVDGQERLRLESAPVDATRRQPEHRGQQRPEFGSTALGPKPSATESPPSDGNNHHASPKLPPTQPVVKATTYSRGAPPPRRASPRPSATRVVARNNELESHLTSSSALTAGAMNMLAMSCGDENRPCGQTHAATSLGLSRAHLGGSSLALANGLGPARNGDARAMQYEMESHMSMHREMLLRKTDQLTLFETDDPASAAVPPLDASSWNLEADIDDELFHFLAE